MQKQFFYNNSVLMIKKRFIFYRTNQKIGKSKLRNKNPSWILPIKLIGFLNLI